MSTNLRTLPRTLLSSSLLLANQVITVSSTLPLIMPDLKVALSIFKPTLPSIVLYVFITLNMHNLTTCPLADRIWKRDSQDHSWKSFYRGRCTALFRQGSHKGKGRASFFPSFPPSNLFLRPKSSSLSTNPSVSPKSASLSKSPLPGKASKPPKSSNVTMPSTATSPCSLVSHRQ